MASSNRKAKIPSPLTHEGGKGAKIDNEQELRRSVMCCLLFENTFYEKGSSIATRIADLITKVDPNFVADLAVEARERMYLRHVPLFMVRELARAKGNGTIVANTLPKIIQRADEMGEYLSLYYKDDKDAEKPISAGSKRGLARAFAKFNEYALAKYNRASAKFKPLDVARLVHPRPISSEQAELWGRLAKDQLATPDTWEVALSTGKDKRETFTRLIQERKLGGLALLRNLRLMEEAGVDRSVVREAIEQNPFHRVLPFRFVAAEKNAPHMRVALEKAMLRSIQEMPRLSGDTVVLIDVSGSMDYPLSAKSDLHRIDVASTLGAFVFELCPDTRVFTFSNQLCEVSNSRGFELMKGIVDSQVHGGTALRQALNTLKGEVKKIKRLIIITDEQSNDGISDNFAEFGYVINVANYKTGVGYPAKGWVHIDGWSERVMDFIIEYENQQ